ACPAPRAAAAAGDDSEDGFVGWIDLHVATQFPRLHGALEAAVRTGRATSTADEYFHARVCRASSASSCPSVLL
mgnify:CR=1